MPEMTVADPPPAPRIGKRNLCIALLWLAAAGSVAGMALSGPAGWDVPPLWAAVQAVGHGASPYRGGIAALEAYQNFPSHAAGDHAPFIFWYSPATIPVLRVLAWFPGWLLGPLYWCAVAAGLLLQLRAGYAMASTQERRWLVFLLPLVALFPGLLSNDVILSGNVAYILYGLLLTAAIPGWRQNKWLWFYAAVLAASICKTPLLTLLAFPVLVGKRQWAPASVAGAAGCLLFAVQPLLWPAQFKEFLLAVRLVFDWVHDFGLGPSGLLGRLLFDMKLSYSPATTIVYLVWAAALAGLLLATASRVRRWAVPIEGWIPVALVGTVLFNPRLKEYDLAAITIPLILIAWRSLRKAMDLAAQWRSGDAPESIASSSALTTASDRPDLALLLAGLGWFVAINVIAGTGEAWRPTALAVLLLLLSLGIWTMHRTVSPAAAS